ncbi:MAG: YceH family protein [Thiolinea sp.]
MLTIDEEQKPPFSAEEIRILGCLMEKQLTTPNNYPLTLNSLMLACNQKSSREPVMNLKEGEIGHIARALIEFGWVVIQNSGRAQRVEHRVRQKLKLSPQQQAILAVLMLRRPQTLNEIKTRTERMAEFSGADEVQQILDDWLAAETPLVMRLAAGGGRREDRYYHTLGTEDLETLQAEVPHGSHESSHSHSSTTAQPLSTNDYQALLERMTALEQRVGELEDLLK